MRQHVAFRCGTDLLAGTLDLGAAASGVLMVSGGNETRAGAFSGQAEQAARLAAQGVPVFRFDRRGVGDSEGANVGFKASADDIAAALAAFRKAAPHVTRVVGFGNCDAASALMLVRGAGCDALVLANPWTFEDQDDSAPAPAAIRARYREKLANPAELMRLVRGQVSFRKLGRGLLQALKPTPAPSGLLQDMAAGLSGFGGPVRFLIAGRDRTGQAFEARWSKTDKRIVRCPDATHAFSEKNSRDWLQQQLLEMLSA